MVKQAVSPLHVLQVASAALRVALLPVVLLLPAGTWRWPEAWLLSAVYGGWALGVVSFLSRHDPELLRERSKASPVQAGQPLWDRVLMVAMLVAGIALIVVPGLDVVRYGWSRLPWPLQLLGFLLHAPSLGGVVWVMRENTFLSRVVKVDEGRGHHVITTGPYAIVRHPMYAAVLLAIVAMPLALGSAWGLLPALAMGALIVARTALEDRQLHRELPGYAEYATRTRYRLIPGVW